jgi:phosphatidylethanolamine/phosphatidyl-N-methylethanolamine N-methyltransferase
LNKTRLTKVSADMYYEHFYPLILAGGGVGAVAAWTHRSLEHFPRNWPKYFKTVLEIGAGNGEHFKYVKHDFQTYIETDIRIDVLSSGTENRKANKVSIQKQLDANNLSGIKSDSIDRLIATCVLVHLDNPVLALTEIRRLLKNGGVASFYVPCEPGMFLRFLRYWTTARKGRRLGVDHLHFHYNEHRFHVLYIQEAMKDVFELDEVKMTRHPFKKFGWNLNLWQIYQIRVKKSEI